VDMLHLEGLEEPQDLDVSPLAGHGHQGLEQAMQRGELRREVPALERCGHLFSDTPRLGSVPCLGMGVEPFHG